MKKRIFRFIALIMFIIAMCFLVYALAHPEGGIVFYFGNIRVGSKIWSGFYLLYTIIMLGFFTASFFIGNKNKKH